MRCLSFGWTCCANRHVQAEQFCRIRTTVSSAAQHRAIQRRAPPVSATCTGNGGDHTTEQLRRPAQRPGDILNDSILIGNNTKIRVASSSEELLAAAHLRAAALYTYPSGRSEFSAQVSGSESTLCCDTGRCTHHPRTTAVTGQVPHFSALQNCFPAAHMCVVSSDEGAPAHGGGRGVAGPAAKNQRHRTRLEGGGS